MFLRLDLTGDNRYTLSKATKDILRNLEHPVTITAYFSKDLPPHIAKNRQDFKEMLEEFTALSKRNVVYEFQNPNENEEIERAAMQKGIQPFLINVREKDQVKQQKAFMGAVIQYEDKEEILPFIPIGTAMEYSLASSIKKVTVRERKPVAFIQGHGEPSMEMYRQVLQELNILYDVTPVIMDDENPDALMAYQTIVLAGPADSIPETHFEQIDRFLNRGGKMLVAINRVEGDLSQARGYETTTGLETWLMGKGISVENVFAIDAACANVMVQQDMGGFRMQSQVMFPYFPNITNFQEHPVTKGLDGLILQFASPISFLGDSTITCTTLMTTSENSGTQPAQTYFDVQKQWTKKDFTLQYLPVAVLLESRVSTQPFKMIVFGNGNFAVNGEGRNAQRLQPDNVNVFVNAIDYLSDDTGLISLRTKTVNNRPIEQVEDGKKAFLKYFNFSLPLLLIIGYGFFRAQRRKILRLKRMQKGFVD